MRFKGAKHMMDPKVLRHIRRAYFKHTFSDFAEHVLRRMREKVLGVDLSVFDKTLLWYREARGQSVSPQEALARALDKQRHKSAWHAQERKTLPGKMHFYTEVEVYPFRQPYLQRRGGFRWYMELVRHLPAPRIVEYGCGSAVLTEWLVSRFPRARFFVADIPSVTLEFVKWKKERFGYPYEILTIGPGREGIPLEGVYDLILCQDVLEHTPNPLEIVTAFVEHLAPAGVLVMDFLKEVGGENLPEAFTQREEVKALLRNRLIAIKAIDEPAKADGLYVKDDRNADLPASS